MDCYGSLTAAGCRSKLESVLNRFFHLLKLVVFLCLASLTPVIGNAAAQASQNAGGVFKDCAGCPEMVVLAAGSFTMGSGAQEQAQANAALPKSFTDRESPQHSVRVKSFAMGKTEVTRRQFTEFVSATGHKAGNSCFVLTGGKWADTPERNWRNPGYSQTDSDPVACVNWDDAQAYVRWIAQRTAQSYRLPSESEWEYACRAGVTQTYCGSDNVDSVSVHGRKGHGKPLPVAGRQANAWGLYDMSGNVWEWTQDCWNETYSGAPSDGSAWTAGDCDLHVLRGGSALDFPQNTRAASRNWDGSSSRINLIGFRIARDLP